MLIKEYRITLPMTVEEYQVHFIFANHMEPFSNWGGLEAEILKCLNLKLLNAGGTTVFGGRGLKKRDRGRRRG